jgi:hypothetical protein
MDSMWWGMVGGVGSLVVEIYIAVSGPRGLSKRKKYKRLSFWLLRSTLIVFGGVLATIYGATDPRFAFSVGFAAPVLLQKLLRQNSMGPGDPD